MLAFPPLYLLGLLGRLPLTLKAMQATLILHTISWPVINISEDGMEALTEIGIGYWVWLSSMVILFIAVCIREKGKKSYEFEEATSSFRKS
ncbi:hypothetical protein N9059_01475 [bacterium]|nr:hypothetical protein [bacterium]